MNESSANGDQNADTQQRSQQEEEWESAKSSAKLFERSRIRALAGINVNNFFCTFYHVICFVFIID